MSMLDNRMRMRFPMVVLFMLIKRRMLMRSQTCGKMSSIFSCFPCARRTRKELCHPRSLLTLPIRDYSEHSWIFPANAS